MNHIQNKNKNILFYLILATIFWTVNSNAMEPEPTLSKIDQKLFSLVKARSVHASDMKKLCEQGANIFAVDHDNDGKSLLHIAADSDSEKLLDTLLALGKKQDSKQVAAWCDLQTINQKRTALHCAAFRGSEGCIKSLLQAGANPNIVEKEYNTPVFVALLKYKPACAKLLIDNKKFDFTQKNGPPGATILHQVCTIDEVEYVQLIVEKAREKMDDTQFEQWLNDTVTTSSKEQVPAIFLAAIRHPHYLLIVEYLSEQDVSLTVKFLGEDVRIDNFREMARVIERVTGKCPIKFIG